MNPLCDLTPAVEAGYIEFLGLVAGVPVYRELAHGAHRYIIPRFQGSEMDIPYCSFTRWCGWFVDPEKSFMAHCIVDTFPPETEEAILQYVRLHHKLSS